MAKRQDLTSKHQLEINKEKLSKLFEDIKNIETPTLKNKKYQQIATNAIDMLMEVQCYMSENNK